VTWFAGVYNQDIVDANVDSLYGFFYETGGAAASTGVYWKTGLQKKYKATDLQNISNNKKKTNRSRDKGVKENEKTIFDSS